MPNAPTEVQGGVRVDHNNLLWYGLTWHVKQGWMIAAGFKLKQKLSIGYSFDIYTAQLSVYESGSNGHELIINYEFLK